MKKAIVFSTCVAVITTLSAVAYAHKGATGIVKERMDGMMALGKAVRSISAIMQGNVAYDAEKIRQDATVIKSHAGEAMTKLFPEGSLQKPSVAKPEIWSDWEGFSEIANQLALYADGLGLAASNGLKSDDDKSTQSTMGTSAMMGNATPSVTAEALAAMPADSVFNLLTQTCSSCHTKFRVKKK